MNIKGIINFIDLLLHIKHNLQFMFYIGSIIQCFIL